MERSSPQPSLLSSGRLLSAYTFPSPYSKNLSGEVFRKGSPPHLPKCVGVYKVKILGLKISHLGAEEHRKDDDLLLELSL